MTEKRVPCDCGATRCEKSSPTVTGACGAALLGVALALPGSVAGQALEEPSHPTPDSAAAPMSILVHITHGPEHPTRAALGFAVAAAAVGQGHRVTVFLAGDGVQLARAGVIEQL